MNEHPIRWDWNYAQYTANTEEILQSIAAMAQATPAAALHTLACTVFGSWEKQVGALAAQEDRSRLQDIVRRIADGYGHPDVVLHSDPEPGPHEAPLRPSQPRRPGLSA